MKVVALVVAVLCGAVGVVLVAPQTLPHVGVGPLAVAMVALLSTRGGAAGAGGADEALRPRPT